ncbi:hypothetical protein ACWGBH_17135, partial [Streptomyces massasporeus]
GGPGKASRPPARPPARRRCPARASTGGRSRGPFFDLHRTYDRCYTRSWLVSRLITALYGYGRKEREALIRACARGEEPPDGPREARAILSRHAPLAAVMTDFYVKIQDENRQTPYPSDALRRALRASRPRRT